MARGALLLVTVGLLTLLAAPVSALTEVPDSGSPVADEIATLYERIWWTAVAVFVIVEVALVVAIVKWGPWGKGEQTNEAHRGNNTVEIAWTIVPAIILLWIGIMSFQTLTEIDTIPDEGETIEVVGHQWFWEFRYENGLSVQAVDPTDPATFFHVPAGEDVILNIRSSDVGHALNIPALGVKVDAYPDRINQYWFNADEPGEYFSQCAEYCGTAHSFMRATIVAEDRDDYEAWLDEKLQEQQSAGRLTQALTLTVTDEGFQPATLGGLVGALVQLTVDNEASVPVDVRFGEPLGLATGELAPGDSAVVEFETDEAFETIYTAGEAAGTLVVAEGRIVDVSLSEWAVDLSADEIAAGELVVFNVVNDGEAPHNLYLGTYAAPSERADPTEGIIARTRTLNAGETASFALVFDGTGTLEAWCDISGHYQLGMISSIEVV